MATKKVDLIIVEGLSDEMYLYPLKLMLANADKTVHIHVTRGDITTNINNRHAEEIKKRLHEIILDVNQRNKFGLENIRRIIHIVDIDAIYCADDDIIEDASTDKVYYDNNNLITNNKNGIIRRNENKAMVLDVLNSLTAGLNFNNRKINIPYSIYYFSICADHVLLNKLNLTDEDKRDFSMDFAAEYKNNLPGFKNLLDSKSFIGSDYKDSWLKIKSDKVAFDPRTNVNLLVDEEE